MWVLLRPPQFGAVKVGNRLQISNLISSEIFSPISIPEGEIGIRYIASWTIKRFLTQV